MLYRATVLYTDFTADLRGVTCTTGVSMPESLYAKLYRTKRLTQNQIHVKFSSRVFRKLIHIHKLGFNLFQVFISQLSRFTQLKLPTCIPLRSLLQHSLQVPINARERCNTIPP